MNPSSQETKFTYQNIEYRCTQQLVKAPTQEGSERKRLTFQVLHGEERSEQIFEIPVMPISFSQPNSDVLALIPFLFSGDKQTNEAMAYFQKHPFTGLLLEVEEWSVVDYQAFKSEVMAMPAGKLLVDIKKNRLLRLGGESQSLTEPEVLTLFRYGCLADTFDLVALKNALDTIVTHYTLFSQEKTLTNMAFVLSSFLQDVEAYGLSYLSFDSVRDRLLEDYESFNPAFVGTWSLLLSGVPLEYFPFAMCADVFRVAA